MFGEQLQSSCRRVNFALTVFDSQRTFHRLFNRHYLDIKHVKCNDKFGIVVSKKCPVTGRKGSCFKLFFWYFNELVEILNRI